jgi:clan AA aspartic protease (TIGR02281 family)
MCDAEGIGVTGRTLLTNTKTIAMAAFTAIAAISAAQAASPAPSVLVNTFQPAIIAVPFARDAADTLSIQATLNGTTPLTFLLDTGATNVVIPKDVAARLMREGTLTSADYIGDSTYIMGDGHRRHSAKYRLKSVTVGGLTVTDVKCTIGGAGSSLLLGQSFLQKFSSYSIDNSRGVLVLGS